MLNEMLRIEQKHARHPNEKRLIVCLIYQGLNLFARKIRVGLTADAGVNSAVIDSRSRA